MSYITSGMDICLSAECLTQADLRPLMATMALDNVGPDQGEFTSGDGDNDRGRALHFGEESGSDFIVRATCR